MKTVTYLFLIALVVIGAGAFMLGSENNIDGDIINQNNGDVQRVVLNQDGYNYKDAVAQAGKPISLSADNSVQGCLRSVSFNIDGKRYSKYLRTSDDILDLPALSKGTYNFACSMGMGSGRLIIE